MATTPLSVSDFGGAPPPEAKTPPYSIYAEQAVVGGLLIDNDAWLEISQVVKESDFFIKEIRSLFREISVLAEKHQPFDVVTLGDRLQSDPSNSAGSLAYLATLAKDTPSSANIKAYATIVHEKAVRRNLIKAATDIIEEAYKEDEDQKELLDRAEQSVFEIAALGEKRGGPQEISKLSVETYDHIENLRESGPTGLKTGFAGIDRKTLGLERGELVVVAGRPSMGKTSFAMNIVENVALGADSRGVIIFSMEMSARQIASRFFSSLGRISAGRLRTGALKDEEWAALTGVAKQLQDAKIFVDDTGSLTPLEIHAKVRRLKRQHPSITLVMVDYLQLMQMSGSNDNRTAEISQISRSMKVLAREQNVVVVALSQLNRAVESRQDKRPLMSDLRESGAIEQDADLIMMLYRDEAYNPEAEKGIAEVRIVKQRNGPLFTSKLTFLGEHMRFEDYVSEDAYKDMPPPPQTADTNDVGL